MKKIKNLVLLVAILTLNATTSFSQSNFGSLPVILVDFSTSVTADQKIAVTWTTQQQINTDLFKIEKSNDCVSWTIIKTIPSTGTSSIPVTYTVKDAFPVKGQNYYRLLVKNFNGLIGYTPTMSSRIVVPVTATVYPNPAVNTVTVSLGEIFAENWTLFLIDNAGRIVFQKRYFKNSASVSFPISAYPNGIYTIEVADGFSRQSKKLIINHH